MSPVKDEIRSGHKVFIRCVAAFAVLSIQWKGEL